MYGRWERSYAKIGTFGEEKERRTSENTKLVKKVKEVTGDTSSSIIKNSLGIIGVVVFFALIKYLPYLALLSIIFAGIAQTLATDQNTEEEQVLYEYMAFEESLLEEEGYL